jgi:alkanesulfonate monooxygenase SsuD/methylene tetrahydromethanopterin reductase-like flavin-dependent oxidoreductase (luciferase family)
MRFSFKTGLDGTSWHDIEQVWRAAEELPVFDAGWVNDHLQGLEDRSAPSFEPFTALAALAAITERLRLGIMVAAVGFRNPALIAKQAVTLDHLSGGRFELGIGAGWMEREHADYGLELLGVKQRLDRFEEAAAIVRSLLHQPATSFTGRYYSYDAAPMAPGPVQATLPIVIGGHGERRTIPIAASYADHYNFGVNKFKEDTPEKFARKRRLLDEAIAAAGRSPSEVEGSVQIVVNRTARMAVDLGNEFLAAGADHIVFFLRPPLRVDMLHELAAELG